MHIEYIVGALEAIMLKLSNATSTFPNPPTGESIALRSPPTLPSAKPAFQAGTEGADFAAAAPRHPIAICGRSEAPQDVQPRAEPPLTVGIVRPRYEYAKMRQLVP
jgi:hypothetical protein